MLEENHDLKKSSKKQKSTDGTQYLICTWLRS